MTITKFLTVFLISLFLSLEWIKHIVEKFRSDDAVDIAILKSLTLITCESGPSVPSVFHYCNNFFCTIYHHLKAEFVGLRFSSSVNKECSILFEQFLLSVIIDRCKVDDRTSNQRFPQTVLYLYWQKLSKMTGIRQVSHSIYTIQSPNVISKKY